YAPKGGICDYYALVHDPNFFMVSCLEENEGRPRNDRQSLLQLKFRPWLCFYFEFNHAFPTTWKASLSLRITRAPPSDVAVTTVSVCFPVKRTTIEGVWALVLARIASTSNPWIAKSSAA